MVAFPERHPVLFTPAGVELRIPLLASIVPEARDKFRRLSTLGYRRRKLHEKDELSERETERLAELERMIAVLQVRVETCAEEVEGIGGQLVDLDAGEVTFPAWIEGSPAYIVWRPGDLAAMYFRLADEPVGQSRLLPGNA